MTELKASVRLDMGGNLETRTRRADQALSRMSQRGQRHMRLLSSSMRLVGNGLDRLGNRYTAFLTGGGLALAGRQVVALETRFTRLGIQANRSVQEMDALKRLIYETARAPQIRVDPGEVTAAVEAIVEKTGDLAFAEQNIRNIGIALQATGANGQAVGELLAEFQKMDIKGADQVLRAIDTLTVQGKEGAFTLQNLAALGPRVITAYTGATKGARDGAQVLKEMGAALQVIRMGTGSSEQAATAFERLLAELQDPAKIKLLRSGGIQVFDPKQPGAEVLRPINEILLDILTKTKGRRTILGQIFGDESLRAFNALTPERMAQFMRVQGDGATTMADAARAARTASAALQNLSTAWQKFADSELSGPVQSLADGLNSLEPGTVDRWMQVAKWIGIIGGGAVVARKGYGAARWVIDAMGGKGKGLGGALGSAAGAAGVTPVFVTNMPGAGLPGAGIPGGGSAGGSTAKRTLAKALPLLGRASAAAGPLAAIYGVSEWAGDTSHDQQRTSSLLSVSSGLSRMLSVFGLDKESSIEARRRANRADLGGDPAQAELHISVSDDRVKVSRLRADGMAVDVDAGAYMVAP